MKIYNLPLSNRCRVVVFHGREDYSISNSGYVCFRGKYIETKFSNERLMFRSHKMHKYSKITEKIILKLYEDAGLPASDNPIETFEKFLLDNEVEGDVNERWIIVPNTSKQLKGKSFTIEFEVGAQDFSNGSGKMDLDVFMTPITKTSKSVKFTVEIPKFLYDKCITCTDVERRPKKRFIEAETISTLHAEISKLVSIAHSIWQMEKDSENSERILCINFSSAENITKDAYQHGYTGQKIDTSFNFYEAYRFTKKDLLGEGNRKIYTLKRFFSGIGSTDKGRKGIIDTGDKQWIETSLPKVIIPWTQEREDFLYALEGDFRKLSERLNLFLKDLNEESLQKLIDNKNNTLLLGN